MPEPKTRTIAEMTFEIAQPFEEGHVCTAGEAKALNQTRAENVGNNLRKQIEAAKSEGKSEDEIRAMVAEYDAAYELTLTTVATSRKLDPVEREARAIAKDVLKEHLAKTGRKLTKAPEGETDESWKEKVEAQIELIMAKEEVVKAAQKRVKEKQRTSEALLADMDQVS